MKAFRKAVFWLHLASGTLAGIFIFIMCITGALLSFESNLIKFAERDVRIVNVGSERLTAGAILNSAIRARSNAEPSALLISRDPELSAAVSFGREGQLFIDPYTGDVLGEDASGLRGFLGFVEDVHRWLAFPGESRAYGKSINGAANLLFLFLAISGVYIWFPKKLAWRNFKPVIWFRRGLRGKARNFNWHNVIGFWTSLVLVILTATAVVMSYKWANDLLYRATGNEPPAQQQRSNSAANEESASNLENIDQFFSTAANNSEWKTISLRLPVKEEAVLTVEEGIYWNIFARSPLTLNPETGEIMKWEPYGEQNGGKQLRSWARFTHTGETGGFIGQLIGFVACVGGAFLVWTGFSLALRRFGAWRKKRVIEV
ncbi:MAG: PepSY domain-containing protein [Pyrinomonadaceae bacterium]|nr:PepSY domain-containing protein [Pyrinomonadaceae bacterium]